MLYGGHTYGSTSLNALMVSEVWSVKRAHPKYLSKGRSVSTESQGLVYTKTRSNRDD